MRVGHVPYLHTEPFYFDMQRRGIELCKLAPSALTAALVHGEIDAGPVPLIDYFALEDRLQPVSGFCVASVQPTGSVCLYSTRPLNELSGARIGMTDEAATAARLLDVLLHLQDQGQPAAYVPLQADHEAFLLMGNQALRQRMGVPGFPYTYDLEAAWQTWTGLPFVFSRWMVRQDLPASALALLKDTLYIGLEEGVEALFRLAEPREELLMLPRDVVKYIQGFRYYIGMAEQQAIDRFRHAWQQLDG